MNEQEDQFYVQPEIQQLQQLKPITLPKAFPSKKKSRAQQSPRLKMVEVQKQPQFYFYKPFKFEQLSQEQQDQTCGFIQNKKQTSFDVSYPREQCVYQRHDNSLFNTLNGITYHSGQFANRNIFSSCKCNQTYEIADIMQQFYDLGTPQIKRKDKDLLFDSHFEGGNLHSAYKVGEFQYDLMMSNDTNSTGNNQWFYFSVSGLVPNKQYTFSIINFTKSDSLFNYGLAPAIFSLSQNRNYIHQSSQSIEKEHVYVESFEKGWKRRGKEVTYKKGKLQRQNSSRMYYRLSFKISTSFQKDKLWIAHSFPYGYSKLVKFIDDNKIRNKQFCQKIQIGKTISKRVIQGLVICFPLNKKRDNRKAIIIMSRQHPGECQGSFVCQGVIEKLLQRSKQSELLLKNYVFYIIPMVNPDGVVFGHYRTNLAGKDLNRKWNIGEKDLNCPEVTAIKGFLSDISKQREIRFILDLHGHSKKLNSFFYGNPYPQSPQVVKIFPYVCSKLHSGIQYMDCTFATEQQKRKAARVYLSYAYKLIHIYTFESSFYCYQKQGQKIQFTPKQYRQLGSALVAGLHLQLEHEVKYQQSFEFNLKKNNTKEFLSSTFVKYLIELRNNKLLLQQGTLQESGSDSRPEQGEINNEELQFNKLFKIQTPTLAVDKEKQSISKSLKASRKTSQLKQYAYPRPGRNLKLLQISKINSVLPDKDQFCLQPSKKKQISQTFIKLKAIKATAESQTQLLQSNFIEEINQQQLFRADLSNSISINRTAQPRSVSLVKSYQNRNNIIFKLDFMNSTSRKEQMYTSRKTVNKHAFSQTLISFNKIKESIGLPQLEKGDKIQQLEFWSTPAQIKLQSPSANIQILKKQSQFYLGNMMKKIFNNKQSQQNSELSKRYMLDKNFNIKKKELHRK